MCDPITITGIALGAGSLAANTIANNKIQDARSAALATERLRQGRLDQEAQALNTQSQDRYVDFEGQQTDRAAELGDYFASQQIEAGNDNASATAQSVAPQSGSNITVREEAKQRGQARDFADQQGRALGDLRSFGDLLGEIGRDQSRDAMSIGQINSFKKGWSNVLPFELEAANQAGGGMQTLGDILGLGSTVALGKGLSSGKPGLSDMSGKFPNAPTDPWEGMRGKGNLFSLYDKPGLY